MLLLRSKIEPFCAFTIDLGPQYVERVFDSLLTRQGIKQVVLMPAASRLERYLELLHGEVHHSGRRRYAIIQFYIAHFYQQLAGVLAQSGVSRQSGAPGESVESDTGRHFREKAICHYESYLELAEDSAESRFYARWQSGLLQYELDYPWSQVEAALLKATTSDPLRGEPLKNLIDHYCRSKSWRTAYSLSVLAMKTYFGQNPAAHRRWFVDFAAYDWHLLQNHLTICYKLGRIKEAGQVYRRLEEYAFRHPEEGVPVAAAMPAAHSFLRCDGTFIG